MKKRKTMMFLIKLAEVFVATSVCVACYFYTRDKVVFYMATILATFFMGIVFLLFMLASKPSKDIGQRWESYS